MNLYTYQLTIEGTERNVLSCIDYDKAFTLGLTSKNIIGYLREVNSPVVPDNITYNTHFIKLFQSVIEKASLNSEDLKKTALEQKEGYLYVIDQRAVDTQEPKPQDILGAFEIKGGKISNGTYQSNPNYQIISERGLFKLPENFEEALLKAMLE